MNITDKFLSVLKKTADIELSDSLIHQVERCLLDYSGVIYAGRKQLGNKLECFEELASDGCCSVIAANKKADLISAAMLNGFAAHIIELDDGHRIGAPHLEAVIISAMIGIAQKENISFERFIKGIVIGYEAVIRLSTAMQPELKLRGFHATGVCGAIGVACAAGYALGLNDIQLKSAGYAAASGAAGILEVLDDNSELKPFNVSNAAASGITAVFLAKCGFRGPDDVLGGKRGYFHAHSDNINMDYLLGESDKPLIFSIYVKPFASCRHSHPAVECALKIIDKNKDIATGEIESIEVQTYKLGITAHDNTEVSTVSAAKMSTPYSVAASMVLGSCGMDAFSEESVARRDIRELTRKVTVVENKELTERCPLKRGAIVSVKMKSGGIFTENVDNPLGEPENSLSDAQLENKFVSLMTFAGVTQAETEKLKNLIWNIGDNYKEFIEAV